jgi:hypothetical protein
MIDYIEKGPRLHAAIANARGNKVGEEKLTLANIDGVWVSNNDEAVQEIIDNFDALHAEREDMNCSSEAMELALSSGGLLALLVAKVARNPVAEIRWRRSPRFDRLNPLVLGMIDDQLTPTVVDDIFRAAMAIESSL